MDSRGRPDHREAAASSLITARARALSVKARLLPVMRAGDSSGINAILHEYTGLERDYATSVESILFLLPILAPGWEVGWLRQIGNHYHLNLRDATGGRSDYRAKFVSRDPRWVLLGAIISLHLQHIRDEIRALKTV